MSMRTTILAAFVAAAGLLILASTAVLLGDAIKNRRPDDGALKPDDPLPITPRPIEPERKFPTPTFTAPVPPTPEEAATFREFFDKLSAALVKGDEAACSAIFDVERFAAEIFPGQFFESLGGNARQHREAFLAGVRGNFGKAMVGNPLLRWEQTDIRRVRRDPTTGNVVVLAYHRSAVFDNRALKIRWWFAPSPDGWKIYDFEELDLGLRYTHVAGSFADQAVADQFQFDPNRLKLALHGVREAMTAMAMHKDVDEADRHLEAARGLNLPAPVAAVREMIEGVILMGRGAPEAGLKRFDIAERLQPSIPALKNLRAMVAASAGATPNRWS